MSSLLQRLQATAGPVKNSRPAGYAIKALLAAGLLGWLAWRSDWSALASGWGKLSPGWLLLIVGAYLLGQAVCAAKWGCLASGLGFRRPPRFYAGAYFCGMFASLFLPTMVGGDVLRGSLLARGGGARERLAATVSVLADRGTGLLALFWLAAGASALQPPGLLPAGVRGLVYGIGAALTLAFATPFFLSRPAGGEGVLGSALGLWRRPALLLGSLALALLFQALNCGVQLALGRAMGLPAPPAFYFLLCPLASVAGMLPFTLGGTGERAAASVVLLRLAGVTEAAAVAFSLAWTAVLFLAALCGGLVFLLAERPAGNFPGRAWNKPVEENGAASRPVEGK